MCCFVVVADRGLSWAAWGGEADLHCAVEPILEAVQQRGRPELRMRLSRPVHNLRPASPAQSNQPMPAAACGLRCAKN